MPGSVIVELIVQPLAEGLLHIAGYLTGRVIVPAFSLGLARVEPIAQSQRKRVRPAWQRPHKQAGKPLVLSAEVGALLGLVFWFAVGAAVYLICRRAGG